MRPYAGVLEDYGWGMVRKIPDHLLFVGADARVLIIGVAVIYQGNVSYGKCIFMVA